MMEAQRGQRRRYAQPDVDTGMESTLVRWGIHNARIEDALCHPLSPSQLQMSCLTAPGIAISLPLLCAVPLLTVRPWPEHSVPNPVRAVPPPPSCIPPPFSQWLLRNLCISYLRTLAKRKTLEDHAREQNNTQRRKILDDHLGLRAKSSSYELPRVL